MFDIQKKHGYISKSEAEQIKVRHDNICAICGKEMLGKRGNNDGWNIDHIVPQAVFKWCKSDEEGLELMNDERNLLTVHTFCNTIKGEKISTVQELKKMHVDDDFIEAHERYRHKVEPYITKFFELKYKLLKQQNYKCKLCGRSIVVKTSIIRRVDSNSKRYEENACLVCKKCLPVVRKHREKNNGRLRVR